MKLREEDAPGSQPIDVGCIDVAAMDAEVRIAEIIGNDQQDIRSRTGFGVRFWFYGVLTTAEKSSHQKQQASVRELCPHACSILPFVRFQAAARLFA